MEYHRLNKFSPSEMKAQTHAQGGATYDVQIDKDHAPVEFSAATREAANGVVWIRLDRVDLSGEDRSMLGFATATVIESETDQIVICVVDANTGYPDKVCAVWRVPGDTPLMGCITVIRKATGSEDVQVADLIPCYPIPRSVVEQMVKDQNRNEG